MIKKNILITILIILLFIIILFAFSIFFLSYRSNLNSQESIKIDKNIKIYSFDEPFVSNIKDSNKILKIIIKLEISNSRIEEVVDAKNPEIRHEINLLLRGKTEEDLKGSEGQSMLQREILDLIKKLLDTESVKNVYFDEFIIT
ncbi:MAG: flagellar basal body-associated FliL family protein [Clostridiales bacterium]|nr:flagellar basal body-associated FliL family protein [Clostridiales bacterium]